MISHSLRKRLVGTLVLGLVGAWIFVSFLTYQDARREIDEVLDAHLAQAANLLALQANHELLEIGEAEIGDLQPYTQTVTFQVWNTTGTLLIRSPSAPETRLSTQDTGFSDTESGQQHWRVYARTTADGAIIVQMAESREGRERLARRFMLYALWPLVIGVPMLATLVWIAVSRALQPLSDLRKELSRRDATDLSALDVRAVPTEVIPLVEHLNGLFERIRGTLEAERRFTSQAAHELRTPIAAIRAQAESAVDAPTSGESQHALQQVIFACDRLSRTVGQLLTLARMDEAPPAAAVSCSLDEIATRVIADLAPEAIRRGTEIGLRSSGAVRLAADATLIEVLLRNLIDNAVRHSGPGRQVDVEIAAQSTGPVLTVTDDGAGVSADELRHLGRTFFRGSQSQGEGTGIGLSIVGRIAERYGASVHYSAGPGNRGLQVSVRFHNA